MKKRLGDGTFYSGIYFSDNMVIKYISDLNEKGIIGKLKDNTQYQLY